MRIGLLWAQAGTAMQAAKALRQKSRRCMMCPFFHVVM
jgi:hypothetical protein